MNARATGPFTVKMTPQTPSSPEAETAGSGRMALDKRYEGDLEATSAGEMLSAMGEVEGSAGYVAMERVRGTLAGREGSFVLLHRGLMNRGAPTLDIVIVPDSGTGELVGLSGTMEIDRSDGTHRYAFEYTLPED